MPPLCVNSSLCSFFMFIGVVGSSIHINVLYLISDNEFSGIIYSLFRGRQNITLIIFSICRKMCNKNFENQLTKKKVTGISENIFEYGIFYRKIARRGSNYFPGNFQNS